jgi:hypothetical protein
MAYSNPARAYAEFGKAFAPCLGHWGSAYPPYSKLTTCLYELVGEKGMSEHPTSQDQILLQMGYSHFEPMASGQNDNNTAEADLSDLGSDLQEE